MVFPVEIGKYQDCSKKVEISPRSLYQIVASQVQERVKKSNTTSMFRGMERQENMSEEINFFMSAN